MRRAAGKRERKHSGREQGVRNGILDRVRGCRKLPVVYCFGMGAKETTLKEVGEMLAHVVAHMATKDDLAEIRAEMATKEELAATNKELKSFRQELNDFREETRQNFREIHAELADIRRELDDLHEKFANITGYRKEIDHALERIAVIEKHLGIGRKAAA
jgi:septal ring factor EnvC (AmiA/AmiB activator)